VNVLLACREISSVSCHTEYHYTFQAVGFKYRISYYPSAGRWVSEGKVYNGGLKAMFSWLRNNNGSNTSSSTKS
jgi:hypothetical protein